MFKRLFIGSRKSTGPHEEARNSGLDSEFATSPRKADGPKGAGIKTGRWEFKKEKVIYDSGPGGFAVAVGEGFSDSVDACGKLLAIRWNGAGLNDADIGTPKSTPYPQWFPIPREFGGLIISRLIEIRDLESTIETWPDVT